MRRPAAAGVAAQPAWLLILPLATLAWGAPAASGPAAWAGGPRDALGLVLAAFCALVFAWHLALSTIQSRRFTAELASARTPAEAATRAKGEFLAAMRPESRTPMNGVIGMADLPVETPLEPRHREYAEAIHCSGEALLVIIDDVLDIPSTEAGRSSLHPVPMRLRAAVEDVAQLLALRAAEKGVELVVDADPALPNALVVDTGRLRQVVTNLADDAAKFTDGGHVALRLRWADRGAGTGDAVTLRVEVEDTGCGVPPDPLARMWDEFERFTITGGVRRARGRARHRPWARRGDGRAGRRQKRARARLDLLVRGGAAPWTGRPVSSPRRPSPWPGGAC